MAREGHAEKVLHEVSQRTQLESELEDMARSELDLIDRLRTRQHEQLQVRTTPALASRLLYVAAHGRQCTCAVQAYKQLQAALHLGKQPRKQKDGAWPAGTSPPRTSATPMSAADIREVFAATAGTPESCGQECSLPVEKLESLLHSLGIFLDARQLAAATVQLAPSGAGVIDVDAFVCWMQG